MKKLKIVTFFSLVFLTILSFVGMTVKASKPIKEINKFYYNQLVTEDSKRIYEALDNIKEEDKFRTGDYTIDLVAGGYLNNQYYSKDRLMSDFVAARDTFRFDNSELFYVDFAKLSIRQLQNGNNYRINLGIAREDNYFYDGFDKTNINKAIEDVNKKVDEIVQKTSLKENKIDKIEVAYSEVMKSATYALESTAKEENKLFVSTPYGALVKGEALCEGFARALKLVLDKLGFNSVLVQGMYAYQDRTELHMWNYVQMEDSRWYLLDPTMDNGLKEDGSIREYFMKCGTDKVATEYIADGVVSVTSDKNTFELTYPSLSPVKYEVNSAYFTFEKEGEKTFANYLGKGITETEKENKYIIYTYDTENMKTGWMYVSLSYAFTIKAQGATPKLSDIDSPTRFDITSFGDFKYVLAVTDVAPKYTFDQIANGEILKPEAYLYQGDVSDIYHYSYVNGTESVAKNPPRVIEKSHNSSTLAENKEFTVTVKYSENLKKVYEDEPIKIECKTIDGVIDVTNIKFDKSNPNTLTFTFRTKTTNYRTYNYYFTPINLIGESSKANPLDSCFTVYNKVEFACPKVEGAINTVYTDKPALISDKDMSTENWTDKNGNKLGDNLPFRLALVASKPSEDKSNEMVNKIEQTGDEVLKSSTFELNLQLCSAQVAFLNGQKLKVLMPFPEGYGPEDKGVTFKAYHFKADGTPEVIESVVTENGIVMYVDSFSPFAIVAVKGNNDTRDVVLQLNGNVSVDKELVKLSKGGNESITLKIDGNNSLDFVLLNGKEVKVVDNKITISYDDLKDNGNLLEINTVLKSILDDEIKDGFTSVGKEEINVPDKPVEDNTESKNNNMMFIIIISVSVVALILLGVVGFFLLKKFKK